MRGIFHTGFLPANVVVEGAESETVIDPSDLYYDSPQLPLDDFVVLGGGTVFPGQPFIVVLPDYIPGRTAPRASAAGLLVSIRFNMAPILNQRSVWQADLVGGTVKVEETTWGRIKSLYRE